jgi:hypothetical protein
MGMTPTAETRPARKTLATHEVAAVLESFEDRAEAMAGLGIGRK